MNRANATNHGKTAGWPTVETPHKGYRLTPRKYVGVDGRTRPKVFWLGHDKDRALLDAAK